MKLLTWEWINGMDEHNQNFFQDLGVRVAHLRKEQRLTQAQLAQMLSISQQLMAAYEGGQRRIPINVLLELAKIIGVSMEELVGIRSVSTKRGPTPKLQRQLEQLSRLPRVKQRLVSEMLAGLLQQTSH